MTVATRSVEAESLATTGPVVGETSTRILDAAEQCMARMGLKRFSMRDVALQAGLSRGAVYLHFADRSALIDAVLIRTAERFVASSELVVRRRRTLEAQIAEGAVFIHQHLGDQLLTLRLPAQEETLFAALTSARIEWLTAKWVAFWQPYLQAAEDRGEIRSGLDHKQAGEWIVRILMSFAVMPAVTFDADRPDELRNFVRHHIIAGLAPHDIRPRAI